MLTCVLTCAFLLKVEAKKVANDRHKAKEALYVLSQGCSLPRALLAADNGKSAQCTVHRAPRTVLHPRESDRDALNNRSVHRSTQPCNEGYIGYGNANLV